MALEYTVTVGMDVHWAAAMDWCEKTLGENQFRKRWDVMSDTKGSSSVIFSFAYESDMLLFTLRWL